MSRVVVTGLGCLTPIGANPNALWDSLMAGKSGASRVASFDCRDINRNVGCEIKTWKPKSTASRQQHASGNGDRATELAFYAAQQALTDADIIPDDHREMAVCVGTTMGEAYNGVNSRDVWVPVGRRRPASNSFFGVRMNHLAWEVAQRLGAEGPNLTIPTACAAGNYAIGYGARLITSGKIRLAVAGGADAFSRIAFMGFARLQAMSPDVCRPFDRNRQGLLVGEGSAFLVLEDEERARRRNARIYAEILGCGLSCDGFHITSPHPRGLGAALAIKRVLKEASLGNDDVDYISAHGTGTQANDRIETIAVKRVFGARASRIPISSIKALLGHAMGAASAIEAVLSCLTILHRTVPPTWNYTEPDPDCDLDYVPNQPRKLRAVDVVLSNSFAFGGNNACLAVGRYRNSR